MSLARSILAGALGFALAWALPRGDVVPAELVPTAAFVAVALGATFILRGSIQLVFAIARWHDNGAQTSAANDGRGGLPCPLCGACTNSLKQLQLPDVSFPLLIAGESSEMRYTACPRCMRDVLERNLLDNMVRGNLLWLLGVLPRGLCLLAATYRPGHSRGIRVQVVEATRAHSPT